MLQVILGSFGVFFYIKHPCISTTAGLRVKHNLNLYVIQFYVVIVCHRVKQSVKAPGLSCLTFRGILCALKTFTVKVPIFVRRRMLNIDNRTKQQTRFTDLYALLDYSSGEDN